jgi:hypothetical protein
MLSLRNGSTAQAIETNFSLCPPPPKQGYRKFSRALISTTKSSMVPALLIRSGRADGVFALDAAFSFERILRLS